MVENAYRELVPTCLTPSDFWDLSLSELHFVVENIKAKMWKTDFNEVTYNRLLASDISKVLAGKPFVPISNILPPDPRKTRQKSEEEIEMMLLGWAKNG